MEEGRTINFSVVQGDDLAFQRSLSLMNQLSSSEELTVTEPSHSLQHQELKLSYRVTWACSEEK